MANVALTWEAIVTAGDRWSVAASGGAFGAGVLLWFSYRSRQGSISAHEIRIVLALTVIRAVPIVIYYRHNKRFYDFVRATAS